MTDIVVTGVGAISSAGLGAARLWMAARDGHAHVSELEWARPGAPIRMAAQVANYQPESRFSADRLAVLDRFSQFALIASEEAILDARLSAAELAGDRTAVVFGSGLGGANTIDAAYHDLLEGKRTRGDPLTVPRIMVNAAASQIAMQHRITGPTMAISTACASSAQAIGTAIMLIRAGIADRAIAGGSEAMLTPGILRAWEALRVLTPTLARPFSRGRNGMAMGEGAGAIILERAEDARARDIRPWARLSGYGTSGDAGDLLRPSPAGAGAAMTNAIRDAGLSAGDIGYINAHGTGTVHNDSAEASAIGAVFGDGVVVSSTKPIHGHTIGAAGALELIVTLHALRHDFAPPTINWLERDPNCPVDAVPNTGRAMKIAAAMSNSFAFGGINAVLIVAKI